MCVIVLRCALDQEARQELLRLQEPRQRGREAQAEPMGSEDRYQNIGTFGNTTRQLEPPNSCQQIMRSRIDGSFFQEAPGQRLKFDFKRTFSSSASLLHEWILSSRSTDLIGTIHDSANNPAPSMFSAYCQLHPPYRAYGAGERIGKIPPISFVYWSLVFNSSASAK